MKELQKMKELLLNDESYYLETINNNNKQIGCASFSVKEDNVIFVFEGKPDGTDDKKMSFEEFLSNYTYTLKKEK